MFVVLTLMNFDQTQQIFENNPQEQYDVQDEFKANEEADGIRFAWNIWNTSAVKNDNVPISCLYNIKQPCYLLEQDPILCSKCMAAANTWTFFDPNTNTWTCGFCQSRNQTPTNIDLNKFIEANTNSTTIEYISQKTSAFPPVFMFVIDTSTYDQERHEMMIRTVSHALKLLPDDSLVGLITFGTNINVHSFSPEPLKTIYQFSGDFSYTKKNIRGMEDLRVFLVKKSEKVEELLETIRELKKDPFPVLDGKKPNRCIGSVMSFAISFLEGPFIDNPVKFLMFTQGPCTYGPGKTSSIEVSTEEKLDMDGAFAFYTEQGTRLNDLGHSFDIYAETIADIGFEQIKPAITLSGGNIVLAQDFEERLVIKSLEKLCEISEETGVLSAGFNAKMVVKTTPNVSVKSFMGDGRHKGVRWRAGCIYPSSNLTILFDPNDKTKPNEYAYVQLRTTYTRSDRRIVTKITTFAKLFSNDKTQVAGGFDEEAACITQARIFCLLPFENVFDLETAIDKHLIRFVKKFATWERNSIETLTLPVTMQFYLNYMFFFRRSFVIQKDGISLDESAYFKCLLFKLKPSDAIKLIKPQLFSYSYDGNISSVELSTEALKDDVILVLDSFHNVVQWQGINIVNWIKEGVQNNPDYIFFKQTLDAVKRDCEFLMENRVPVPQYKETAAGKSQERILMTYLCSAGGVTNKTQKINYERFYSALCKHIVSSD